MTTASLSSPAPRAATIYDVADRAGVSHQTVSRLLRGFQGIRPETRAKVLTAIDELGYRPNAAARALKSGRSNRIAALTHEVSQVGPSSIIRGATAAAQEVGFVLDVVSLDAESVKSVEAALEALQQQDLDGVIALASTDEMRAALDAASFPLDIVRADETDETTGHTSEFASHGIRELVLLLHGLGHRRLLHIAGPGNWAASRNREAAIRAACCELGISEPLVVHGDWSAASGYRAVRGSRLDDITAVVAANDQMALGALRALQESGIPVPDRMSVTGVDDIPESAFFIPPLTTFGVDFETRGRRAVAQVLERVGISIEVGGPAPHRGLAERRSTGPAR